MYATGAGGGENYQFILVLWLQSFQSLVAQPCGLAALGNGEEFVVEEAAHLLLARKQRTEEEDAEVPRSSSRVCPQ